MELNQPSLDHHCWDSANGECSIDENGRGWDDINPKLYLFYMLLVISGVLPRLIDLATGGKYTEALSKYVFKEIFWLHGMVTYTIMHAIQPHNLRSIADSVGTFFGVADYLGSDVGLSIMKYLLQSLLAFVLWDVLIMPPHKGKMKLYITCHHLGLFLAIQLGQGWDMSSTDASLKSQVRLDSCLYGWMWSIHSFGFILKHIFPLVGIHLRENERSKLLDNIKYAYSTGTAIWYYKYFNARYQPGVGLNYQTLSLLTMLIGRFAPNLKVPFLRRVEMPAMFIILVDGLLFKDAYLHRSILVTLLMLAAYGFHYVYIKERTPKPATFYGPEENEQLMAFLEAESKAVRHEEQKDKMYKLVLSWFESEPWAHKYPLHHAVTKDDAELVERIIQSGDAGVNDRLREHHDATPLGFANWFAVHAGGSADVILVLLKNGANPYLHDDESGGDLMDVLIKTPLGKRYNEICLDRSPPKELSLREKLAQIPM